MSDNTVIETKEYSLHFLTSKREGPVVVYISSNHFGNAGEDIKNGVEQLVGEKFTFCELVVGDWDLFLSPWESDARMHGRTFGGLANQLLDRIKEQVIPAIREYAGDAKIYIAGYSLAGLFALWSLYESDLFDGAASCSGSVWYPDWKEYIQRQKLQKQGRVYLSLGKKEKKTKHPLMRMVEENMLFQYEALKKDSQVDQVVVEWNEGGHFDNTCERMIRGISWLISE